MVPKGGNLDAVAFIKAQGKEGAADITAILQQALASVLF